MCESEVKAVMPRIINDTTVRISFRNSQTYVTFSFSEWRIASDRLACFMQIREPPKAQEA